MGKSDAAKLSLRWRRAARAIHGGFRTSYLREECKAHPSTLVAEALDQVCAAAEQAEPDARELLVAVVDLLAEREQAELVRSLRGEAADGSLLALGRLLRRPAASSAAPPSSLAASEARIPDYGTGRTLTLGERKALARRPTRKVMEKLFLDPHPAVIKTLLANPKVVEADVVRLAARRPGNRDVLTEIARTTRWSHQVRVRMSLVLNPDSPIELTIPFLALLVRHELNQVVTSAFLAPTLRAAARDLLARRPPVRGGDTKAKLQ